MEREFPFDAFVRDTKAARELNWVVTDQPAKLPDDPVLVGVGNLTAKKMQGVTDVRARLEVAATMPAEWRVVIPCGHFERGAVATGVCERIPRNMHHSAIVHPLRAVRAILGNPAQGAIMQFRNNRAERWVTM